MLIKIKGKQGIEGKESKNVKEQGTVKRDKK